MKIVFKIEIYGSDLSRLKERFLGKDFSIFIRAQLREEEKERTRQFIRQFVSLAAVDIIVFPQIFPRSL